MSTSAPQQADGTPSTSTLRIQRMPKWATGRSELVVAAAVILLAVVLTVGTVTMRVPEGTAFPGPQFFPTIVTGFLYVVGIALAVDVIRSSRRVHVADDPTEINTDMLGDLGDIDSTSELRVVAPEDAAAAAAASAPAAAKAGIDWKTVGITVGALVVFILVMPFVGWLIASAALFWVVSWAFGSTRPLFDIAVSALFAAIVQLAFSAGLGLSLPAGILEGVFAWTS